MPTRRALRKSSGQGTKGARAEVITQALNDQREKFRAFLVTRVGSEADAEDILQAGLTKAFRHAEDLREDDKAVAWFYRLLRNAVTDHYREKGALRHRDEALAKMVQASEAGSEPPEAWAKAICGCLGSVISTLPPEQAELLRQVELEGAGIGATAREMDLTANHASVILHRARKRLRERLETFCGACADGACLDCNCAPEKES